MTVPDYQLLDYIPANPSARINVVFADTGRAAFAATPAGLRAMATHHMISGVINNHGYLKFVRLQVSVRAALRVQRATEFEAKMGTGITTARQHKGSKNWVQRLDRAQTGRMGGQRTVFFRRDKEVDSGAND